MKLLALDNASKLGFAIGDTAGLPEHGSYALGGEGPGARAASFHHWLLGMLKAHAPDAVTYEQPILIKTDTPGRLILSFGFAWHTEFVCAAKGIPCRGYALHSIRKFFIGTSTAPKEITGKDARRKWIKARVIEACRARSWDPKDDNAADALALWAYAGALNDWRRDAGPLFQERKVA